MRIIKKSWLFVNLVIRNTARHDRRDGGRRGCHLHPQFLADQIALFQPEGADYARRKATALPPPFFLPSAIPGS